MTSINNRQPTPYTVGYEMSPKPTPIRGEDSAKASGNSSSQPSSGPSRQPMNAPQLAHRGLANASTAAKSAVPDQLQRLAGQNKQLNEKYDQMVAKLAPQIMKLQAQVNQLTQHQNAKTNPGKEAAPSNPSTRGGPAAQQNSKAPDARTPAENTQASGRDAPLSFERLSAENKQLGDKLDQLESRFNSTVKGLQGQVGDLSKKLGGADTPETRTPPATPGAGNGKQATANNMPAKDAPNANQGAASGKASPGAASGQANQGAASGKPSPGAASGQANQGAASGQSNQAKPAAQSSESKPSARSDESSQTPRTIDDLARDNEQLRARLDHMMAEFTKMISQLQQQIAQLSNQINSLKG
jgi:phage shock protein A